MQLCIFEDTQYYKFEPLVFNRPVFDLRVGISTIREKIADILKYNQYSVLFRNELKGITKYKESEILLNQFKDDNYLFINGRISPNKKFIDFLSNQISENSVVRSGDTILLAHLSRELVNKYFLENIPIFKEEFFDNLNLIKYDLDYFSFLWDIVYQNENYLKQDFDSLKEKRSKNTSNSINNIYVMEAQNVYISEQAKLGYGVVLDASNGPIIIDDNAIIMHNVVIYGPCYIGKNSLVKSNTTIYGATTIGDNCKVAGEISNSIMMDYSNKQHDGFLGHSYLGSWVNLGAGTITSNLKNNYSKIQVQLSYGIVKTDVQFIGLLAGDHLKSAIGTRFNTATVVGFSCNIFGSGLTDKFIPSFTWGSINNKNVFDLQKAIEVASKVYQRRGKNFLIEDHKIFSNIFKQTSPVREKYGYK